MLRKLASFFTYIMRHNLPDAYLFAILLTFLSAVLAFIFTPSDVVKVITTCGDGVYGIIAFAMQMILVLVTGYVLALTPPMKKVLDRVAGMANTPVKGAMIVAFVGGVGSWVNWGFGLIFAGLLALEVARRTRKADFPMLIAAGYSGFVIWNMGFSGSIPLLLATPKNALNLVEKLTGKVTPVSETIFAMWNFLPAIILILTIPILFYLMHPKEEDAVTISAERLKEMEDQTVKIELLAQPTLAERINHSYVVNMIFAAMGVFYLFLHFSNKGLDLNLNIVIFIFFIAGVILHTKPINYVKAVDTAIRSAGGIALQFPLYGGIMGIMIGTGLAKVIAGWFVAMSTPETFYMLQLWGGRGNQSVCSLRRRPVGRPGTDHHRGGQDDEHRYGQIRYDGGLGRSADQYDPALLGLATTGSGRPVGQRHHGLHDHDPSLERFGVERFCPHNRLWRDVNPGFVQSGRLLLV